MEKEIELEQEAIVVYSGGGAVNSVNGYTGDVVLTTSDLENTSDYQTGTEVESAISTAIAGKQDTLTAGNNITISNNTISATDTTYSAGTGLTLNGTQFSVDTGTIATQQDVSNEATARENADINLQGQIDAISAASDVTDIVGTYAALQAYDTTHLKDNDIIKVLQDESQDDETTYYRWSTSTHTFTLIGEEGPYYTKSQADTLLNAKQNTLTAGSNVQIVNDTISATDTTYTAGTGLALNGTQFSVDTTAIATQSDLTAGLATKQDTLTAGTNIQINNNTISATDTTYSAFTGTDGQTAGTAGLVPAPATTDAGKFLKADGTWDTTGGGGDTVYSTVTTSNSSDGGAVYIGNLDSTQAEQSDPTSTDNHYKYFWALPYSNSTVPGNGSINIMGKPYSTRSSNVTIGKEARAENAAIAIGTEAQSSSNGVAIGYRANYTQGDTFNNYIQPIAIGFSTEARTYGVALGSNAKSYNNYSVAIGYDAHCYQDNSIALGKGAYPTRQGEVNVGCDNTTAFNNTNYRVIGGVHDGQNAHDAATVGQITPLSDSSAPTTATVGRLGQIFIDTTTATAYMCVAVDTVTPSYTWKQITA